MSNRSGILFAFQNFIHTRGGALTVSRDSVTWRGRHVCCFVDCGGCDRPQWYQHRRFIRLISSHDSNDLRLGLDEDILRPVGVTLATAIKGWGCTCGCSAGWPVLLDDVRCSAPLLYNHLSQVTLLSTFFLCQPCNVVIRSCYLLSGLRDSNLIMQ